MRRSTPVLPAVAIVAVCQLAAAGAVPGATTAAEGGELGLRILNADSAVVGRRAPRAGSRARLLARAEPSAAGALLPVAGADQVAITYDDGEVDVEYGPVDNFLDLVMRFDLPRDGMAVDELRVCLARDFGTPAADLDLELTFWEDDGPGGEPGTLIDFVSATALGVTATPTFFVIDLSLLEPPVVLPDRTAYVGVGWDGSVEQDFLLCADHDASAVQPGYFDVDQAGDWTDIRAFDPDYTALMIRGVFADDFAPGPCVAGPTTMCLQDDRFRVEVDWATQFGTSGPGVVVPFGSDDSGLFYFFNADNWEMLIKVLDGCPLNGHFWVFFAATTDVEFTVTVTDTDTGAGKQYRNPLGQRADAITDTAAFATCP